MVDKSDKNNKESLTFKFVILGDTGVGKTSLLHNFIFSKFKRDPKQTVNVEYASKVLQLGEKDVRLQLWDTAGQERYRSVTRSYYKGALGVLIVYDLTKADSFQQIPNWLFDAKNAAKKDCTICIVGNKCDLKEQRAVKFNDGAKFCQDNGLIHFECSAFTGESISDIFHVMTRNLIKKIEDGLITTEENKISSSLLNISKPMETNTKYKICGDNC